MEYQIEPYPSSVPHSILVPGSFQLDPTFYVTSLILELFFLLFVLVFFGMALYFRCGNYRLMIDRSNQKKHNKQQENIICQVLQKTNFLQGLQQSSQSSSSSNKFSYKKSHAQQQLAAPPLRLLQRRGIYVLTFTSPWIFCICFFDSNIILIIFAAIFIPLAVVFNIVRVLPNWKISILIYILPAIASVTPYISGEKRLYDWTPVVDPLLV